MIFKIIMHIWLLWGVHMHGAHMWRSEDNCRASSLSFPHVGSRMRVGSWGLVTDALTAQHRTGGSGLTRALTMSVLGVCVREGVLRDLLSNI